MPETIKRIIKSSDLYKKLYSYRWRERKVSFGNGHAELTYYVIRRHASQAGLFSFYVTNLSSIKYSLDHQLVPVIDMQNSANPLLEKNQVGKVNGWELFFEQPMGVGLNDLTKAKNVILSSIEAPKEFFNYDTLDNTEEVRKWRELAHQYIRPVHSVSIIIDNYCARVFHDHYVLGILCRGTDYVKNKPQNHPIQPEISTVIGDARKLFIEKHFDLIYLATEDVEIWKIFQQAFPDKVVSYQKTRYALSLGENINDIVQERATPYQSNLEYLISIGILSKCDGLLAGAAGGTYGALLMGNGFDYCKIYQLGKY